MFWLVGWLGINGSAARWSLLILKSISDGAADVRKWERLNLSHAATVRTAAVTRNERRANEPKIHWVHGP